MTDFPPPPAPPSRTPWWKIPVPMWGVILIAFAGLILGSVAAGGDGSSRTVATERSTTTTEGRTTATGEATTTSAAPTTTEAPTTTAPTNSDEGWVLEQVSVEPDFSGSYGGTGRVLNTADESRSGIFTITFFDGGGQVLGSMQGSAQSVGPGQAATVDFISQDDHQPYDHTEFQTDTTYAD